MRSYLIVVILLLLFGYWNAADLSAQTSPCPEEVRINGFSTACRAKNQGVLSLSGLSSEAILRWESRPTTGNADYQTVSGSGLTFAYFNLTKTTDFRAVYRDCNGQTVTGSSVRITIENCDTCLPPRNLTAVQTENNEILLRWEYSGGFQTFRSRYRENGSLTYKTGPVLTGRSYRWPGLLTCENYEFILETMCGGDTLSSASVPVGVSMRPTVTGLRLVSAGSGDAVLSWNSVGRTTARYQLRYRVWGSANWTETAANLTGTERRLIGLMPLTEYEAEVQSICPSGLRGERSPAIRFKTGGSAVSCTVPPAGIKCVQSSPSGAITVSWQPIPGAKGYELRYGDRFMPVSRYKSVYFCVSDEIIPPSVTISDYRSSPGNAFRFSVRTYCGGCEKNAPGKKSPFSSVIEWRGE